MTEQERLDFLHVMERQRHLDRLADERDAARTHYEGALARLDQAKQDLRRAKEAKELAEARWESAFGTGRWARRLPPIPEPEPIPEEVPAVVLRPLEECEQAELFFEPEKEWDTLAAYETGKRERPGSLLLFRHGDTYEAYQADAQVLASELGLRLQRSGKVVWVRWPIEEFQMHLRRILGEGYPVALIEGGKISAEHAPEENGYYAGPPLPVNRLTMAPPSDEEVQPHDLPGEEELSEPDYAGMPTFQAEPPEVILDRNFRAALYHDEEMGPRWVKLQADAADDEAIRQVLEQGWAFRQQHVDYAYVTRGGKRPAFWNDPVGQGRPTYQGKVLIARVREVLKIPRLKLEAGAISTLESPPAKSKPPHADLTYDEFVAAGRPGIQGHVRDIGPKVFDLKALDHLNPGMLEAAHLPNAMSARIGDQPALLTPVRIYGWPFAVNYRGPVGDGRQVWEILPLYSATEWEERYKEKPNPNYEPGDHRKASTDSYKDRYRGVWVRTSGGVDLVIGPASEQREIFAQPEEKD